MLGSLARIWVNLRIRLMALVLIAIVPGLGLNLVLANSLRESTSDRLVDQAELISNTVAVFQRDRVREIEHLLEGLSDDLFIRNYRQTQLDECQSYFAEILDQHPQYVNVGMFDSKGISLCEGLSNPPGRDNSDRTYYQRAVESKSFAVGDFQIGRSTGLPGINFAYPVVATDGRIIRVVFVAVLAGSMGDVVADLNLNESATVTIADENGTILSLMPENPELIGDVDSVQPAITALESGESTARLDDFLGVADTSLVISREIQLVEGARAGYVFLSIPESAAFADVNRIVTLTNSALIVFLVVALGLAGFGLDKTVIRPVRTVVLAANRLSTGDLSSRTGIRNTSGEMGQLASSFDDMASALEEREAQINQAESRLTTIFANIEDGIVTVDPDGIVRMFNQGAETMFGINADAAVGRPADSLFTQELGLGSSWARTENILTTGVRDDGSEFPAEVSVSKAGDSGVRDVTAIVRDITERVAALEAIERRADFDAITELPNTSRFVRDIDTHISGMEGEVQPFSVFVAQIDELQSIEDNFGYEFTQQVTRAFAGRLIDTYGEHGAVAHIGADAFAVMHVDKEVAKDALGFSSEIQSALEEPFSIEGESIVLDVGVGISLFPGHGESGDELVRRAGVAARMSDNRPSRTLLFNTELEESTFDRVRVLSGIREALENNELLYHYQPKVDIQKNEAKSVEALVRWQSSEGLVPPGLFIPVVESSGYLWPMTAWGIGTAIEQLFRWNEDDLKIAVSVNVSAHTFRNPALLSTIESSLQLWGVDPAQLDIELTETAVMEDPTQAEIICKELRATGATISIDDFGVGQSPLAYLDRLPVNAIKIDREFVLNIGRSAKSDAIVESIVRLGSDLGLTVVAEGVEDEGTVNVLREMGCHEVQGYVFARPAEHSETAKWISEYNDSH